MRPDPGGGPPPTSALTLLDVRNAAYVKGVWEGYQEALAWARKAAAASVPTQAQWQGDRADRFRAWWQGAQADLDNLWIGTSTVISALEVFIAGAWSVNEQLATVEYLFRSNCQNVSVSAESNSISGEFTVNGTPYMCTVTGSTMQPFGGPIEPWPEWLQAVRESLYWANWYFQQASDSANQILSGAMAYFTSMRQFRHLGRGSTAGDDPMASDDPTWQQLTGGGVFRMPLSGFTTDPFGTELMPDWYDPTMGQKVSTFIGDHAWIVDIGAIVLAAAGQPEAAVGLEVVMHGTKLVVDVTDGNKDDVPWDAVDLVLDKFGVDRLAESITDHVMYHARHALEPSMLPQINARITGFVQARLREQVQETVNEDGTTELTIPASELSQVAAEAQAELNVLLAGHVPASAMD